MSDAMTNPPILQRLLREPLVHFLLAGAALFAVFALVRDDPPTPSAFTIVVDDAEIQRLETQFERTWLRPPRPEELDGLIQEFVREEVLYREALALGLDDNDLVVRRRMRQKLEFALQDLLPPAEPTEAQLEAFLAANETDFREPARYSFLQVFLNPDARGDAIADDVAAMLAGLRAGGAEPSLRGDPTLLPPGLERASVADISRVFGEALATAVAQAPVGDWSGPHTSTYGMHLMLVTEARPGRLPALAQIRDQVAQAWSDERQREADEAFYRSLRDRYTVIVAGGDGATGFDEARGRP